MIINPKNAPFLSTGDMCYVLYLQNKMDLLQASNYDYKMLVDVVYSLGQVRQEIFDDEDISTDSFLYLISYVDDLITSIKKCEEKMRGGFRD